MPSQGEDLAVLSLCNHSIIGVRRAEGLEFGQNMLTLSGGGVLYLEL